jgi:hypothetical protein
MRSRSQPRNCPVLVTICFGAWAFSGGRWLGKKRHHPARFSRNSKENAGDEIVSFFPLARAMLLSSLVTFGREQAADSGNIHKKT